MASKRRLSLPQNNDSLRDVDYQVAIDTLLDHQNNSLINRDPCLLLPHVYVGDITNAESFKTLRKYGITHVLNCAGYQGKRTYEGSPYQGLPVEIHYKEIKAQDSESYDISQHFDEAFRFLDRVKRQNGCALVHCAQGINRSVAICAAYLMLQKGYTLLKTVLLLKRKRGAVLNNRAFQMQLVHFARSCGLLDSQKEFDKLAPKMLFHKNGLVGYQNDMKEKLERRVVKPQAEMNCVKPWMEPEFSFSFTKELNEKDKPSKYSHFSSDRGATQSNPIQSDSIIENYMRKLVERSACT